MSGYLACDVRQAAVAQLHVVFIADLVQSMVGREVLFKQAKELFADVGLWAFAIRRVEPDDVSFSGSISWVGLILFLI